MRLGMLQTNSGRRLVAVQSKNGSEQYLDLQAIDHTLPGCLKQLLQLDDGIVRAAAAEKSGLASGQLITGKLLAPIGSPQKVICIGLNYRDHAKESGAEIPSEPVCFGKFSHCVIGPEETIRLPKASRKVDYEAELVAVIGRRGKNIPVTDARAYVAGYTIGHDVSARDWQLGRPGGQWLLGKTADTFAPIGPYLVTADEIADPQALRIQLRLNGTTMQDSNTREFIFGIDELIAHVSQIITLEPGDLLFTGTPPGVGGARKPPVFLKPGDSVEIEIDGLGVLRNPVAAEE